MDIPNASAGLDVTRKIKVGHDYDRLQDKLQMGHRLITYGSRVMLKVGHR